MLKWSAQGSSDVLLLFIHGLMGGEDTWISSDGVSFQDLIIQDPDYSDKFDIACFNYYSKWGRSVGATVNIFKRLFKLKSKIERNLPIDDVAELLKTNFYVELKKYKKVIIIAHSMGGLISKSCIIKQIQQGTTNIVGFISVAVPHSGAVIANYSSFLNGSDQIKDLSVLSSEIDKLNREWMSLPYRPIDKYLYGSYDKVVTKNSAIAIHVSSKDECLAINDDHLSICKPENRNELSYKSILMFVNQILECTKDGTSLEIKRLDDKNIYDDEYFVLKLVLGDIHKSMTGQAKEYFYNAEYARRIFTSDDDKNALRDLYDRVKEIYEIEYQGFISSQGKMTSDTLLYNVHRAIMDRNDSLLKTKIHNLSTTHKTGMLHQLANNADDQVIWTDNFDISSLKNMKVQNNE